MRQITFVVALLTGACLTGQAHAQSEAEIMSAPAPEITADTVIYTREQAMKMKRKDVGRLSARAEEEEAPGVVQLTCQVGKKARLSRCVIVKEEPAGYGFGEAAAMPILRLGHVDAAKFPEGAWIRQTMRFTYR